MGDEKRSRSPLMWIGSLLVVGCLAAFLAFVWGREKAAQGQLERDSKTVEEILAKTVPAVRVKVNEVFLADVSSNPSCAPFMDENRRSFSVPDRFIDNAGSAYSGMRFGYLGTNSKEWKIVLHSPHPTSDFSKRSAVSNFTRVCVTVRCARDPGVVPRLPCVEIIDHSAPQNPLLIDALRSALNESGIDYTVKKSISP